MRYKGIKRASKGHKCLGEQVIDKQSTSLRKCRPRCNSQSFGAFRPKLCLTFADFIFAVDLFFTTFISPLYPDVKDFFINEKTQNT